MEDLLDRLYEGTASLTDESVRTLEPEAFLAAVEALAGLQSAHGYLQKRVASELRLKNTPTLQVLYDDSADRGMRIAELLQEEPARTRRRLAPRVHRPAV